MPYTSLQKLIIDKLPIAVLIINHEFNIRLANKAAHTIFGYESPELINTHLERLIPVEVRAKHEKLALDYFKTPVPKEMSARTSTIYGLKKDNTVIPLEVGLFPYKHEHILVIIRDLSIYKEKAIKLGLAYLIDSFNNVAGVLEKAENKVDNMIGKVDDILKEKEKTECSLNLIKE